MIPDLAVPSGRYLSLAEREEISRGLAVGEKPARIACRLGRHRSTIKREIDRNHVVSERRGAHSAASAPAPVGPPRPHRRVDTAQAKQDAYRAGPAQTKADQRARRPKPTKFSGNPALVAEVQAGLRKRWSPEQVVHDLRERFPDSPEMQVSHETICECRCGTPAWRTARLGAGDLGVTRRRSGRCACLLVDASVGVAGAGLAHQLA